MFIRKSKKFDRTVLAVFIMILAAVVCVLTFIPDGTAFAVLPQSYVDDVENYGYDWWMGEDYLNVAVMKKTVESWFSDIAYDFSELEDDPVVIAVIDTGISLKHELFTGKYEENGEPINAGTDFIGQYDVFLRNSQHEIVRKNTVPNSQYSYNNTLNVVDDSQNKHGTHVAGIIATLIHKLDLEKYIKIMPIKAAHGGTFLTTGFQDAVTFALENGADVVNMSLSSESSTYSISSEQATKAVFVAAAGNSGTESRTGNTTSWNRKDYWPAASPNVIGVMNYMRTQNGIALKESSNYGTKYDVCAPGTDIYSANGMYDDKYQSLDGTSMASPIVAFGAALATLKYRARIGQEKRPNDIAQMIRDASSSTITKNGAKYAVFDMNLLIANDRIDFYSEIVLKNYDLTVQQLGSIQTVEMSLTVSPIMYQDQGNVDWFIGDEKIGSGFWFAYTPPSEVGSTTLTAVWSPPKVGANINGDMKVSADFDLGVEYIKINGTNINNLNTTVNTAEGTVYDFSACRINVPYNFTIDTENMSPDDVNKFMWYVNGEFVSAGEQFTFVPEAKGDYKVEVKINGISKHVASLRVWDNNEISRSLLVYTIVAAAVIAATVFSVILAVLLRRKRKDTK